MSEGALIEKTVADAVTEVTAGMAGLTVVTYGARWGRSTSRTT